MNEKTLVAFFSHSGNTRLLAQAIQRVAGGDLHEVIPAQPYPRDYNTVVQQADEEIRIGYRPALASAPPDLGPYQRIFVGTPNWWDTMAPPLATFLEGRDLAGKTILPFCTHGGSGAGRLRADLARLCPGAHAVDPLEVFGNGGRQVESLVRGWLLDIS